MSSSMLEQAIIDAQTLKEAAIKNAEQEVLEKYSGEIKEAVNSLLEQNEFQPEAVPPMGEEVAASRDKIVDELPLKVLDGEKDCLSCLEEGELIELDLNELQATITEEDENEISAPLGDEAIYEVNNQNIEDLLTQQSPDNAEEEEIELDEESLKNAIAEILKVDLENVPRGMLGTTHPTKAEQEYAVDVALAADEDTERKEKDKILNKKLEKLVDLEEQVKSLKSDKNRLIKEYKELKSIARKVSDKLTTLNLANAKLVYQNRILESHSLNERQKEKLVDAVSNANSTKEAKVIYETLQDSLSYKGRPAPKNLSEAISKNNRLVLKSNKKESQVSNSAVERMKKLAGII